jgi:hypothetical protein
MRIDEVESGNSLDPNKLMGLVNFLSGRADDQNAQKQISTDAFISTARSLGFPVSEKNIVSIVSQPPLDSVLEPMDPQNPRIIKYKGSAPEGPTEMPVNKAQDIVAASAKQAAAKDRGV